MFLLNVLAGCFRSLRSVYRSAAACKQLRPTALRLAAAGPAFSVRIRAYPAITVSNKLRRRSPLRLHPAAA